MRRDSHELPKASELKRNQLSGETPLAVAKNCARRVDAVSSAGVGTVAARFVQRGVEQHQTAALPWSPGGEDPILCDRATTLPTGSRRVLMRQSERVRSEARVDPRSFPARPSAGRGSRRPSSAARLCEILVLQLRGQRRTELSAAAKS